MQSVRMRVQDIFCATWVSDRVPSRIELSRALNHRSHRRWMVAYLERKSELARLNVVAFFSLFILWLRHHINFRMRQVLSGAWLAAPAQAIEHARAALQHPDPAVREDGLAILAYFGDATSLRLIRPLFDHSDPLTRSRAHLAVRAIERQLPILFVSPGFTR